MTAPPAPPLRIHEATRALDSSGRVFKGALVDGPTAVALRQAGLDVVVCGDDVDRNREAARDVEAAVGPYLRAAPHLGSAGPHALPHYQQAHPPPGGHTFYETANRKAR